MPKAGGSPVGTYPTGLCPGTASSATVDRMTIPVPRKWDSHPHSTNRGPDHRRGHVPDAKPLPPQAIPWTRSRERAFSTGSRPPPPGPVAQPRRAGPGRAGPDATSRRKRGELTIPAGAVGCHSRERPHPRGCRRCPTRTPGSRRSPCRVGQMRCGSGYRRRSRTVIAGRRTTDPSERDTVGFP